MYLRNYYYLFGGIILLNIIIDEGKFKNWNFN